MAVKYVDLKNTPDSCFKLSTVANGQIVLESGYQTQLNKVMTQYQGVVDSLNQLKSRTSGHYTKYQKKFTKSDAKKLKDLADGVGRQAKAAKERKDAMNTAAKKDHDALEKAAQVSAFRKVLEEALKDPTASAGLKAALTSLLNIVK